MKNEYKVNKKLMMSWAKKYYIQGTAGIILFVLEIFLLVLGLALLALLIAFGGDFLRWYCAFLFLFISVFKLFFARFIAMSRRHKVLSLLYGVSEWTRTIEFGEDEITITDHNSTSKVQYSLIKKIKDSKKKNEIEILSHSSIGGLKLYKDAFVEGSWEECRELLLSKMEKKDQTKTTETTEGESL